MIKYKYSLWLSLMIILVSYSAMGQTDSLFKAKYYSENEYNQTFYAEHVNQRIFKPFLKQMTFIIPNFYTLSLSKMLQMEDEFWFVYRDTLMIYGMDGIFKNSYHLIDPILNDRFNKDLIDGMCYDGHYIYAVNNDNYKTIFVIDPVSKSILNKIYATEFSSGVPPDILNKYNMRWITYDASADSNRGGFWVGNNYKNFSQIDRNGHVLKTIVVEREDNKYINGVSCDNVTPNGAFLWCSREYSLNDGEISPISLKEDTTFGKFLPSYHNFAFDENNFSQTDEIYEFRYPLITNGYYENQPVLWVFAYTFYSVKARCYPLSFPTKDVSVEPFTATHTYTQWPLYAIDTVWFKGKLNNASPYTQMNVSFQLDILKDGNVVQNYSSNYNLQPFENKEVVFGPFFPMEKGIYTLKSHAILADDEDHSNDEAISTFTITDSTFGRDTWDFLDNPTEFVDYKHIWGPSLGLPGDGGSDEQGALFTIDKPMVLTSITAYLKPTEANDVTTFDIHSTENYIHATPFAQTVKFSAKWEDTGKIKQYTIPIRGGKVHLDAGTYYINIKEGFTPNRLVYTRNNYVPYINLYEYFRYYYVMEEVDYIRGALTIRPNFACKTPISAPSISKNNQVLSCNTNYTDLKYQWYKNNQPIEGAIYKNYYHHNEGGSYKVRIQKENCYEISEAFEIVTGILDNVTKQINIYPNPCKGFAYINSGADMFGDMDIQIVDVLGKVIDVQTIKSTNATQTIPIDLKDIATGVYIVYIQIGEQNWEGKLVVE